MKSAVKEISSFSVPIVVSTLIQSLSEFADNSTAQIALGMCDLSQLAAEYADCLAVSNAMPAAMANPAYRKMDSMS